MVLSSLDNAAGIERVIELFAFIWMSIPLVPAAPLLETDLAFIFIKLVNKSLGCELDASPGLNNSFILPTIGLKGSARLIIVNLGLRKKKNKINWNN